MNIKIVFLAFTVLISLFVSCLSSDKNNKSKSSNESITKIGVIMPLTGSVAEPGKNTLNGLKLGISNQNEDSYEKIELIIEDSKSNPKDGVSAINKLILNDGIKIIIGDIMSSVLLACAPVAESNKAILFSPGASAPEVSEAGDYVFRNNISDDFDGKVMAKYIKKSGHISIGIISVNNDYGIGVSNTFKSEFEGKIAFHEQYQQGENDFRAILEKSKKNKFDALYLICNPSESGHLIKQLKEMNINTSLFGNLSFDNKEFINVAKESFDEIVFSTPYFNLEEDTPIMNKFKLSYKQNYTSKPDIAAALGYDVAIIISTIIKEGNNSAEEVKNALYKLKNFKGVTGNISFDDKGDVLKDIQIKKIFGNGEIESVEIFRINE